MFILYVTTVLGKLCLCGLCWADQGQPSRAASHIVYQGPNTQNEPYLLERDPQKRPLGLLFIPHSVIIIDLSVSSRHA